MNKYTENWTREDFVEFRKLKRKGYTNDELLEHFGDVLYEDAGIFNRNCSVGLPFYMYKRAAKIMSENPKKTLHSIEECESKNFINKKDYNSIIKSFATGGDYYIRYKYEEINNIGVYNLIILTLFQSMDLNFLSINENISEIDDEMESNKIIYREEELNSISKVIDNIVFALKDFSEKKDIKTFSVRDIGSDKMIDLYKKIIYQSFDNVIEDYVNNKDFNGYIFNI